MTTFTAILDACVLYPAPLRDLLVQFAVAGLYRARWTEEIHDEWIDSVLKDRSDLTRERLQRTRELMNRAILDSVVRDYEQLIPGLELPDANDRHVMAAAIKCGASVIVTNNLKDFPLEYVGRFGIEAQHPDDFLACQFDMDVAIACAAIKAVRQRLRTPPKSIEDYIQMMEKLGLSQTVQRLKSFEQVL